MKVEWHMIYGREKDEGVILKQSLPKGSILLFTTNGSKHFNVWIQEEFDQSILERVERDFVYYKENQEIPNETGYSLNFIGSFKRVDEGCRGDVNHYFFFERVKVPPTHIVIGNFKYSPPSGARPFF